MEKVIKINNINYKVIGVYEPSNTIDFDGDTAYIPFSTFKKVYNTANNIDWMMITANEGIDIEQMESDVLLTLKNLHKVHPEDERAFGSVNLGKEIAKFTGFLTGMQFLTWFVGIATLIAGVFAIGNILLITVKERTKEIGIRRALGATPKSIRQQIILESVFLTTVAGMIGIILGATVLKIIDTLFGQGVMQPCKSDSKHSNHFSRIYNISHFRNINWFNSSAYGNNSETNRSIKRRIKEQKNN